MATFKHLFFPPATSPAGSGTPIVGRRSSHRDHDNIDQGVAQALASFRRMAAVPAGVAL